MNKRGLALVVVVLQRTYQVQLLVVKGTAWPFQAMILIAWPCVIPPPAYCKKDDLRKTNQAEWAASRDNEVARKLLELD